MGRGSIGILIADDHYVVRMGLVALVETEPDLQVIGEAADGVQAVELFKRLVPDLTLMDLRMPRKDGITATREIREQFPEARILMLTTFDGDDDIHKSLSAGANGYLLKDSAGEEVVAAIRAVHSGERYLSSKLSQKVLDDYVRERSGDHPLERLSARELQVLKLIVEGKTSNEVAVLLGLSPKSIESYRSRLMLKLGIDDMPGLVKFAIHRDLTSH